MRVVVDTNVQVSAAIKDREPEEVVVRIARDPAFEWQMPFCANTTTFFIDPDCG